MVISDAHDDDIRPIIDQMEKEQQQRLHDVHCSLIYRMHYSINGVHGIVCTVSVEKMNHLCFNFYVPDKTRLE